MGSERGKISEMDIAQALIQVVIDLCMANHYFAVHTVVLPRSETI
jgi:hypothetical protein